MCCGPTTPVGVKRLAYAICALEILVFVLYVALFAAGSADYFVAEPRFFLQRVSDMFNMASIACWIVLAVALCGSVGSAPWLQRDKRFVTGCTTAALVCSVLSSLPVDMMMMGNLFFNDPNKALRGLRFVRLIAIVPAICSILVSYKVAKSVMHVDATEPAPV